MSTDLQVNPATLEYAKQEHAKRGKRRAFAGALGLLLVVAIAGAGYWGYQHYKAAKGEALAAQLAANPDGFGKLRDAVRSGQLTREQAWDAGNEARQKREQQDMDGYFKTPAADRDKYLDKLIDEEQKRWQEFMKNRPTTWPTTRPDRPRGDGPATRPTDAERQTQQRARADNQSPLQRAQQGEFQAAKRAREAARGIQGGWGGGRGGFGGGPGGGRGPGGGGGGGRGGR